MTDNNNHVDVSSAAETRRTLYRQALAPRSWHTDFANCKADRRLCTLAIPSYTIQYPLLFSLLLCIHASHRLGSLQARGRNLKREGPNRPRGIPVPVPVNVPIAMGSQSAQSVSPFASKPRLKSEMTPSTAPYGAACFASDLVFNKAVAVLDARRVQVRYDLDRVRDSLIKARRCPNPNT